MWQWDGQFWMKDGNPHCPFPPIPGCFVGETWIGFYPLRYIQIGMQAHWFYYDQLVPDGFALPTEIFAWEVIADYWEERGSPNAIWARELASLLEQQKEFLEMECKNARGSRDLHGTVGI